MLMGYIIMLTATVLMVTPWTSSLPSVENTSNRYFIYFIYSYLINTNIF